MFHTFTISSLSENIVAKNDISPRLTKKSTRQKHPPISDLLKIAYMVAIKLHLDDFKQWLENELNRYKNAEKTSGIPFY